MNRIDTSFDFTSDTHNYWKDFWECDQLFGSFNYDPDNASKTLQQYHQVLYSRVLPNGEKMILTCGTGANYLTWENFRFGSDSIIASFRYSRYRSMIEKVATRVVDWKAYIENYLHLAYTIGGEILFPKYKGGINQSRGFNPYIRDRWDLTLECIRRYYNNEESPLTNVMNKNKDFFDLFVDFKGYIEFFFLEDCVSKDYKSVVFWLGNNQFESNPFPKTVDEYLLWIERQLHFVEKRNKRIRDYLSKKN